MKTLTDEQCAEYVQRAMSSYKGDDFERANRAFAGFSEKELDQPHGQSGFTRREVWQAYKDNRDQHNQVEAWLKKVLPHYDQ